jgi:hypothetical protein
LKLDPYISPCLKKKVNSKWVKGFNVRSESTRGKQGKHFKTGNDFLDRTPEAQESKEKKFDK